MSDTKDNLSITSNDISIILATIDSFDYSTLECNRKERKNFKNSILSAYKKFSNREPNISVAEVQNVLAVLGFAYSDLLEAEEQICSDVQLLAETKHYKTVYKAVILKLFYVLKQAGVENLEYPSFLDE